MTLTIVPEILIPQLYFRIKWLRTGLKILILAENYVTDENSRLCMSLRVEGLFVLRPVANLDFVSVFNLWA
jgi:hypothetical protein